MKTVCEHISEVPVGYTRQQKQEVATALDLVPKRDSGRYQIVLKYQYL